MIKDILLVASAREAGQSALELAEVLAGATSASLRCLGLSVLPDGFLGYSEGAETREIIEARREQRALFADLEQTLKGRARPIPFELIEAFPKTLARVVADQAFCSDAVVVRAPAQSHETPHAAMIEAALFEGGAPVFVAPLHWRADTVGRKVLICWEPSAAAARAAHAAVNFVARDAQLIIAHIGETVADQTKAAGLALAQHLSRGDINVEWRTYAKTETDIADTLDHVAREISADLIVMGGYQHSPAQQALFGGVTRGLIHAPRLPLLLCH